MPKILFYYFYLSPLILSLWVSTAKSAENEKQVTLVFAANMTEIAVKGKGSYSNLASLLKEVRRTEQSSLFVFGGGSIGPSPMSRFDRGSHIIDILNTLEPDLMTVRKREFSYFEDELSLRSYEAAFPILVSNVYDSLTKSNLEGLQDHALISKGDSKIGFISILEEEVVEEYLLQRLTVFEPQQTIEKLASSLRQQGAEIIVLIHAKDRPYYSAMLDNSIIDVVLRSRPDSDTPINPQNEHQHTYTVSENSKALILDIKWQDQSQYIKVKAEEIAFSRFPEDPTVALQVKGYNERLDRLLNQRIGHLSEPLDTTRKSVRTSENAFANFVTDALKIHTEADIGFINGGFIRGGKRYKPNTPLTRRDITTELPFRSRMTVVNASGEQIKQALEHGLADVEDEKGKFPHVAGLSYGYSASAKPGQRIGYVKLGNKDIDPKKIYSVATSDYIANGGDGYLTLSNIQDTANSSTNRPLISDLVIKTIQKRKSIAPKLESRIVRMD